MKEKTTVSLFKQEKNKGKRDPEIVDLLLMFGQMLEMDIKLISQ
jgi:hypothetical protein